MTYNLIIIGCQMNRADSERLSFYLENIGFKYKDNFLKADLVILVTCGVKQAAEDRAYGLINRIKKDNKKAIIVVTGCLSDRPDVRARVKKDVKLFFNISDLINLNKYLKPYFPRIKKFSQQKIENYLDINTKKTSNFSALVPIGNGCNNFCSYCVVPYARGREIYRPAEDILKDIKTLIRDGYKEINLIAQNVNSYKSEKVDFPKLLKMIDDLEGDFWLRFSSSHPKDVSSSLIKVLKNGRHICEHFHLAVQSGDNDILKLMNRKYKVEKYKKIVSGIRRALDYKNGFSASITTDIIVGFPGETKKNFLNTVKLFKEIKFDLAYISKYSPRHGTLSATMDDNVSLNEKKIREAALNKMLRKTALENNKQYLDQEVEVLVEGFTRKGQLFGRTRTAKIVRISLERNFKKIKKEELIGKFVKIKISKVFEFELHGELIKEKSKVIAILGPTASGKTSLAVELAHKLKGEIISADSRQVYRGMDIGTGKDLSEYRHKGVNIPYHLIDVANPKTIFSLAKYQKLAFKAIDEVLKRGNLPILVGGSGLYLEAVIDNYNLSSVKTSFSKREEYENLSLKELQSKIKKINNKFFNNINNSDLQNKRRLARYLEVLLQEKDFAPKKNDSKYNFLVLGLNPEREIVKEKIYNRLIKRIEEEGMIEEVERLKKEGVSFRRLESFGLEYKFVAYFLQKKINYQQLINNLFTAICQFSKRQMSWFRRWEKQGRKIVWLKNKEEANKEIISFIK